MPTHVYIDGFNLYYGALKHSNHKWLNLETLCQKLLPEEEVTKIHYFTAKVDDRGGAEPQQPVRQQIYLRALATLPTVSVHFGQFKTRPVRLPLANPKVGEPRTAEVLRTEEKGSDVNLATYLLTEGFRREYATAVVITNDSDLKVPIEVVRNTLGRRVGIINPHRSNRRSRELKGTFIKQLRDGPLRDSQFPEELTDHNGTFRKPKVW